MSQVDDATRPQPDTHLEKENHIMAKKTQNAKSPKQRTQVKDLPKQEKELTPAEQKKVKGGQTRYALVSLDRKQEPQP